MVAATAHEKRKPPSPSEVIPQGAGFVKRLALGPFTRPRCAFAAWSMGEESDIILSSNGSIIPGRLPMPSSRSLRPTGVPDASSRVSSRRASTFGWLLAALRLGVIGDRTLPPVRQRSGSPVYTAPKEMGFFDSSRQASWQNCPTVLRVV
jgi:hypothetical protein